MKPSSKLCKILFILFSITLNYACTTITNIVDIKDSGSVNFTSLQASIPLQPETNDSQIKMILSQTSRENFEQLIDPFAYITINDITFPGGTLLNGSYEFEMRAFAYGHEYQESNAIIGTFFGIANVSLDLELSSINNSTTVKDKITNPYLEIYTKHYSTPKSYTLLSLAGVVSLNTESKRALEINAGIGYKLIKNMELLGGIKIWKYISPGEYNTSGIVLNTSGPFISLNFSF